jgi:hypothetical protein
MSIVSYSGWVGSQALVRRYLEDRAGAMKYEAEEAESPCGRWILEK